MLRNRRCISRLGPKLLAARGKQNKPPRLPGVTHEVIAITYINHPRTMKMLLGRWFADLEIGATN